MMSYHYRKFGQPVTTNTSKNTRIMCFRLPTTFTGISICVISSKNHPFYSVSTFTIYSGVAGSGLCILSKHPIVTTLFHSWSVNGYVHRITHGDWFGGKGVGLCRILVAGHPVNIYIAHVCYIMRGEPS